MKFRPCIDIHNGKVKQIVGGSLRDDDSKVKENFVSKEEPSYYAKLYEYDKLKGGHIILLNPMGTEYYEVNRKKAKEALNAYPYGMQIGGGINKENASYYLDEGASHVIVTSYVFHDGKINFKNLEELVKVTGKDRLVLDLSCRKKDGNYYIVTDRWQNYTGEIINSDTLTCLSNYCDEFLIHAVDVEGKSMGIERDLVNILGEFNNFPITYAGGVSSLLDIDLIKCLGKNHVDVSIGSALDLFGGTLKYKNIVKYVLELNKELEG